MYRSRSYDTRPRYSSPLAQYVKLASDPPSPSPPPSPGPSPTNRKTLASPFKPQRPKLRLIVPATRGYARQRNGATDDQDWDASEAETDEENDDGQGDGWGNSDGWGKQAEEDWEWLPKGDSNEHPVEDGGSEEGEVVEVRAVEEGAGGSSFLVSTSQSLSKSNPLANRDVLQMARQRIRKRMRSFIKTLSASLQCQHPAIRHHLLRLYNHYAGGTVRRARYLRKRVWRWGWKSESGLLMKRSHLTMFEFFERALRVVSRSRSGLQSLSEDPSKGRPCQSA
jgi:hypothetical protein